MSESEIKSYTSAYRCCPNHGIELELRPVNFSSSNSLITWYCYLCEGNWAEAYFLYEFEKRLKSRFLESNLLIHCPECSSSDVLRSCHIKCCNGHHCQECDHNFDVLLNVTKPSSRSDLELLGLRNIVWLECEGSYCQTDSVEFDHRSEVRVFAEHEDFEECEKDEEDEVALTLVVNHKTLDERERFSWFCSECKNIYADANCSESVRRQHFEPTKKGPDMRCVFCYHPWFSSKSNGEARCVTCDAEFVVKYGI
jgi:hypothetical protein